MTEVVVTTGATRRAKVQSNCHYQLTNTQFFYTPDALPVAQTTSVGAMKEKYHIPCTWPPKHTWVIQPCLWPLIRLLVTFGRLLSSRQPSDPSTTKYFVKFFVKLLELINW